MKKKKKPLYPVIEISMPFMLRTFIGTGPKAKEIPNRSNRKAYKKFFLQSVRWALEYNLKDASDEELLDYGYASDGRGI